MAKKYTKAFSAADIYYGRLRKLLDAAGELNRINGIYNKLELLKQDRCADSEVVNVYQNYFGGSPEAVTQKHNECEGRISRCVVYAKEVLETLDVPCTDDEFKQFLTLTIATQNETRFREKVRGYICTQQKKIRQEIGKAEPDAIEVLTPGQLILKFQTGIRPE